MTPAQALYEHVERRNPKPNTIPWADLKPEHRLEFEQMAEVVVAAFEGRKPRLRPMRRIGAPA